VESLEGGYALSGKRKKDSYETSCSTGVKVNPSCSACRRRKRSFLTRLCSGHDVVRSSLPLKQQIVGEWREINGIVSTVFAFTDDGKWSHRMSTTLSPEEDQLTVSKDGYFVEGDVLSRNARISYDSPPLGDWKRHKFTIEDSKLRFLSMDEKHDRGGTGSFIRVPAGNRNFLAI
jgi:hypothetical protein